MLKIVWVCLEWPSRERHIGGVGRFAARLARNLGEEVDLTVVTSANPEPVPGVKLVELPLTRSRVDRYYGALPRIRRLVERLPGDLIHVHGDGALVRRDRPIVRTFYGSSIEEARTSNGLRRLNHYVLGVLETVEAQRANYRLAIAPESATKFHADEITPPFVRRSHVPTRHPTGQPSFVFIGSYSGRKQGWMTADVVQHLRRGLSSDIGLTVVGPREDASRWPSWVSHRAGLSDDEVARVVSESWALLAPSRYEGFGIPVLEALEAGVPAVAWHNPGSDYLLSQAPGTLPLTLVRSLDSLRDAVQARINAGPELREEERRSAATLVADLARRGSSARLVEIYTEVLSR